MMQPSANVSAFCQHGTCKVALMHTDDPMRGTIKTTAKDCVNGVLAYGNQVEAAGCNATADPNDPLTLKNGQPGPVLVAHCAGWPVPCLQQVVAHAECVAPDISYDGSLTHNLPLPVVY